MTRTSYPFSACLVDSTLMPNIEYVCYDVWVESTIQCITQCLAISLSIIPKQQEDIQEYELNMLHIKNNVVHLCVPFKLFDSCVDFTCFSMLQLQLALLANTLYATC